ncbi:MAG TPA: hypothetical protein VJ732_07355 [Bryobacteraceae bacterium]|nr:hypothetical protein [Bryobacteraceae bacterium]
MSERIMDFRTPIGTQILRAGESATLILPPSARGKELVFNLPPGVEVVRQVRHGKVTYIFQAAADSQHPTPAEGNTVKRRTRRGSYEQAQAAPPHPKGGR